MKRAAIGIRMHSGWGVLVGVCGDCDSVEVIERRRIVVIDPKAAGAAQPYHQAKLILSRPLASRAEGARDEPLVAAEKYLTDCADVSERLALAAVESVVRELEGRDYRLAGCAVLLAAGRRLPGLEKILGSHPLIHTAEGEFFRDAVRKACEGLRISVTAFPEREVGERAKTAFGKATGEVERRIARMGKLIGPPWTKDHKAAALAAMVVLSAR